MLLQNIKNMFLGLHYYIFLLQRDEKGNAYDDDDEERDGKDHDDDRYKDGHESRTNTKQNLNQKNVDLTQTMEPTIDDVANENHAC
jgi:hypothetical protein